MHLGDWLSLLLSVVVGVLGLLCGVFSIELMRLLLNKERRERQIRRLRMYGLKHIIETEMSEHPQPDLDLRKRREHRPAAN
jgi:hypothetical protein